MLEVLLNLQTLGRNTHLDFAAPIFMVIITIIDLNRHHRHNQPFFPLPPHPTAMLPHLL